jgi:hypothetical protein
MGTTVRISLAGETSRSFRFPIGFASSHFKLSVFSQEYGQCVEAILVRWSPRRFRKPWRAVLPRIAGDFPKESPTPSA